jgi:hypothetical protein
MAEKTTNFGLTKPLPEEFYDVAVQNKNMDIIDEKLKEAMESSGDITPESIGASPINGLGALPDGANINTFSGKNGWYMLNANYSYTNIPAEIVSTWAILTIKDKTAILHGINGHLYHSNNIGGTTIDWKQVFTTEGGTLTGNVDMHNAQPTMTMYNDVGRRLRIRYDANGIAWFTSGTEDTSAYSALKLLPETNDIINTLMLDIYEDGQNKSYNIFGEHNKELLRNALFTASTTDLTAGTSSLETGKMYLKYE